MAYPIAPTNHPSLLRIKFYQRIGNQTAEGLAAFNLGRAYTDIPAVRDLAQAEQWYQRSLNLCAENDRLGRGQCLSQLGLLAYERFQDAWTASRPENERLQHLNNALRFYQLALDLLPSNAVNTLVLCPA